MRRHREPVLRAAAVAMLALVSACSSGTERTNRGTVAVRLAASKPAPHLTAAEITISGVEARRSDGSWVPLESGFPKTVDLLALARAGETVTLPAVLVAEGHYAALQMRITQVGLVHDDGSRTSLAPKASGWSLKVPVDFGVVADHATVVGVNVDLERSLGVAHGEFEFDPVVEIDGVERER